MGTQKETRSYCFIDDVVETIVRSVDAQHNLAIVGPFNLGAEGRVTIREIVETVVAVSGKEIPLEFDPSMQTTLWGQAADTTLARELLNGWSPSVSLREGLEKTYHHVMERLIG